MLLTKYLYRQALVARLLVHAGSIIMILREEFKGSINVNIFDNVDYK